jgi:uncharacterized membrane protein required for colicin V production
MVLITVIAALILVFSFIGGLTQGLVKSFFSMITFIVAVPVAGYFYTIISGWLKFIDNRVWQNFLGFIIVMAVASAILSIIYILPRKILDKTTHEIFGLRFVGAVLNLLGAVMGLVVLTCLINAFPIWEWLKLGLNDSSLIQWLMAHFAFVQNLLPEVLRTPAMVSLQP